MYYHILGFDEEMALPESLLIEELPIPPNTIRPSNKEGSLGRKECDMTQKVTDIVKGSITLQQHLLHPPPKLNPVTDLQTFQLTVASHFDSDAVAKKITVGTNTQKLGSKNAKGIVQDLSSKTGIFRSALISKRFEFSARTVITNDDNLEIDEVGVPEEIADELYTEQPVNAFNINEMTEMVIAALNATNGIVADTPSTGLFCGKRKRVGEALFVKTDKDVTYDLSKPISQPDKFLPLKPGYKIFQTLQNGDIALFNRQPSLHRQSIMCHKVRVLGGKTLRMNNAVCKPYNADYDGDE
jgi:DNA-directed RNA polymerase subunit A'